MNTDNKPPMFGPTAVSTPTLRSWETGAEAIRPAFLEMSVKYKLFVATLCMFASVMANANSDVTYNPEVVGVGITDNKGSSFGLTFTPPDEAGWSKESGLNVKLRKNADSTSDNREIEAYLITLDTPISSISDYIKTIRRNIRESNANSKTFKISTFDVIEDSKDSRCVRMHLLLKAIQPDEAVQERKWSEQYILSCALLNNKGLGVELRYYHRYSDSNKDPQFAEKARKVLDSAIIEDKIAR